MAFCCTDPRTGKTLAQATAGEFGVNYYYVPTELIERWAGAPEANVREVFERAAAKRPIVLFIDELDSLGSTRQQIGKDGDPGGAGRMYNTVTIQLMQSIDEYRSQQGLIIMAATNFLDAVDSALVIPVMDWGDVVIAPDVEQRAFADAR
jgi:ATP-dependent Zn protease